jgi:putative FmdB family regulatory protein
MPIYTYRCDLCNWTCEEQHSMSETRVDDPCPNCYDVKLDDDTKQKLGKMKRVMSPVPFKFI